MRERGERVGQTNKMKRERERERESEREREHERACQREGHLRSIKQNALFMRLIGWLI